ncbi:bifunctional glycosyltransferase transpeptidase penicillin-binding protein 1A [Companilactobacillus paralimentarius DSM 13238 = JCM 10415]|uniref:Bifunctional glycosyltransferase transpeptidase penicillin-binding protein 1A n=1 Tax=Companilactobacillus paralimentarius DSM 13238 = JCM 10415 TaxID=1122151 RepID=A0A0R1PFI7_9LACO|nr:transglycosylase domain-containing protein [Companilactobacillus paralimentarius]KAE9565665.1 penicillin-binding protein [Companilactobacillus paralimentarius]KRL28914.1 bifunctional glycosyltransferase transpeptidase penicillin-binding protein 1A [Companilactobacillus paralimentarius DSM 13238 = JCM 10415]MDR4934006.1 transglycosylase domain-containing protein [Companilactobacillus paralimentarius]QFR70401.1 penicillin-binding protein [Companilactobacillus paralimentarius]
MKNKNTSILTFKNILKWILSIVAVLAGIFLFVFVYYAFSAPAISQENLQSGGSSTIVDSTGKQIASLGDNKRNYVTIDKVPQQMEDAVVSIEDKNFYNEPLGIDPVRIAKSAFNNVTKGTLQGGSTLTQQLVKLTVFSTETKDQTFKRKMQEAWLAMRVSQKFSKQQILEFYMNKVYLNNGIYGVETGAKYYYGKKLKQLSLAQMALLAGLPNAPSNYDPYTHPTEAKQRRDLVIQAMYNNNKITKAQADEAMNTPITSGLQPYKKVSNSNNSKRIIADPYIKEAITEVKKKGFDPYRDNLKITVNMDYDAQKRLYNIVNSSNYVSFPDSKMQVGASVVNPNNGKVVAMIGGRNLGNVQFGLNRAVQTGRSNGSTMKPLLDYAPAIENLNWSTYHQLEDTEYTYAGTNIQLKDWDEQYEGQMSMRKALVNSRNIPAIRTLSAVGLSNAKKFVKGLGINITEKYLSVGIGGNVSSLQGAAAYSAFSNGGTYYKPYYVSKIETADGITHTYGKNGKQAMKDSTAYMITDMLKGVPSSYATYANISGLHQAGKTGTTNYSSESIAQNSALSGTAKDSWYNGYTKNYSISVWTGYDSPNQNGISSTYQSVAGKIYKAEMSYLAENTNSNPNWKKPSSVVSMRIQNSGSETPVVASPSSSSSSYTKELFVKGHAPSNPYKDSDYSSSSASKSSSNEVTTNNHSSSSSESTDSDNDTTDKDNTETGTGTNSDSNSSSDSDNTTTNNSSDSSTTNSNSNTGSTNSNNSSNTNTGNSNSSNSGGTSTNNNSGSDSSSSSNTGDSNSGGTTNSNSNSGSSTNSGATTNGSSTDSSGQ